MCIPDKSSDTIESEKFRVNDPHSYAVPDQAVVKHLNWSAEVDFENRQIRGIAELLIEKAPNAEKLILDTKNLSIEKIALDEDDSTTYRLGKDDMHRGQALEISITPETEKVQIYYTTSKTAEALQWLDPVQTAGKKHPFLFTQSQAILARSWIPIQDSPGIRFTYTAEVKVPKDLLALMSAQNPVALNENGVYRFEMRQPIPAYLMALAVGKVEFEALSERTGVYAEPSVVDAAAYEFADMEKMLQTAEGMYGPYRWERYDVIVLSPSFPFGGMENPRLTFATPTILAGDRSLTSLIAHELAHSWSGNLVTNATWNDFWLNEGFTVYFEMRIMEELYGREYSEMLAQLSLQGLKEEIEDFKSQGREKDTRLKLDLAGRNPDDGVTAIPYDKGYLFLRWLEEKVGREKFGREKFDAFLRKYFDVHAFKVMTTEAFLEYLKVNLFEKNDLLYPEGKVAQWIYSPGLPEDHPKPKSDRFSHVEKAADKWLEDLPADQMPVQDWTTHEWLHFLHYLPDELSHEQMRELDAIFDLTESTNSEILSAWLEHVIRNQYTEGYNSLERFLIETGRRKFLVPLYKELMKTEAGRRMALEIYKKARPNYHYVSTNTLDEIVKENRVGR